MGKRTIDLGNGVVFVLCDRCTTPESREFHLGLCPFVRQYQFAVDVCETHDHMSAAQVTNTAFVTVLADNAVEASLMAAMMASRHGIAVAVHEL